MRAWVFASIVCAALGVGSMARGDDSAARAFERGRTLVRDGRYAEAVPYFLESIRHERNVGALLNLADCYVRIGKSASALARYQEAIALASERRDDRAAAARAAAAELEARLVSIALKVDPSMANTPGLKVLVDGDLVAPADWGRPLPVDPGEHVVIATAPRKTNFEARITVTRKGELVTIVLRDAPADSPPRQDAPPSSGTQRTVGLVVAGLGLASGAVGVAFGLSAASTRSELDDKCPAYPRCAGESDPTLASLNDRGETSALFATVFVAGGAAMLATGTILWLTAPRASQAAYVRPRLGLGVLGVEGRY